MISSLDEFHSAKQVLQQCLQELARSGLPHNRRPEIGLMVEVPSLITIIDDVVAAADFICVGTNDLTQFLFAADRINERVASYFTRFHPPLLRALKQIARAAVRQRTDISICGNVVSQALLVPALLGFGYRKISLDPECIPQLREQIAGVDLRNARGIARKVLLTRTAKEAYDSLEHAQAAVESRHRESAHDCAPRYE